jgi:ABC-type nitrate/sulfonate/bicarbonate transport system permease component
MQEGPDVTTSVHAPETAEPPVVTERTGGRSQPARDLVRRLLDAGWLSVVLGLTLWEILPRSGILPAEYIPPTSVVIPELFSLLGDGQFWLDVRSTLAGYATGLGISIVTAIPLGLIIGTNAYLFRATRAIVEFLRPIPSVALIPLAILVYGISFEMKIFLVTFATFWPLLIQSIYGVQDVDPVARDTARSFGFSRVAVFFRVTMPSAAAYIATGLRLASALAIILAITAELVAGVSGLGKAILLAQNAGANARMYALIVATGLLSYGLSYLLRRSERYVLRWHPSHREPVK